MPSQLPASIQLWFLALQEVRFDRLLRLVVGLAGVAYAAWQLSALNNINGTDHALGVAYILIAIGIAQWALPAFVKDDPGRRTHRDRSS